MCVYEDLFADGNDFSWKTIQQGRTRYYQKQSANEINKQMNEIIFLITSMLNIHLNIEQSLIINTSQVFMSLQTTAFQSLSNQILNGQIKLPRNISSNINNQEKISVRVSFLLSLRKIVIYILYLFIVNHSTTCTLWKFQIIIEYKSVKIHLIVND